VIVWARRIAPHGPITQIGQKYCSSHEASDVVSQIVTTISDVVSQARQDECASPRHPGPQA
jgi:hypothetical protein